jgi:hypothetical protein
MMPAAQGGKTDNGFRSEGPCRTDAAHNHLNVVVNITFGCRCAVLVWDLLVRVPESLSMTAIEFVGRNCRDTPTQQSFRCAARLVD